MESFGKLMFTGKVLEEQDREGSRETYAKAYAQPRFPEIRERERDFIESRSSCYIATVSETGWPYVQHRGGPTGFLKVLGPDRLAFADYPGNRQYISTGNLLSDARVSLFLMDYPRQARLKLLGTVEISEDPQIASQFAAPDGIAPKRSYIIQVAAMDWNCPKYIEPRFTEAELQAMIGPKMRAMAEKIEKLEAQLAKFS